MRLARFGPRPQEAHQLASVAFRQLVPRAFSFSSRRFVINQNSGPEARSGTFRTRRPGTFPSALRVVTVTFEQCSAIAIFRGTASRHFPLIRRFTSLYPALFEASSYGSPPGGIGSTIEPWPRCNAVRGAIAKWQQLRQTKSAPIAGFMISLPRYVAPTVESLISRESHQRSRNPVTCLSFSPIRAKHAAVHPLGRFPRNAVQDSARFPRSPKLCGRPTRVHDAPTMKFCRESAPCRGAC